MVIFQQEDFDVESQRQGRATRSVPYLSSSSSNVCVVKVQYIHCIA